MQAWPLEEPREIGSDARDNGRGEGVGTQLAGCSIDTTGYLAPVLGREVRKGFEEA